MTGLLSRTFETMPFGHEGMTPADSIRPALAAELVFGGLLTAVAGFVDAIGYIGLGGLFASFMSGASGRSVSGSAMATGGRSGGVR